MEIREIFASRFSNRVLDQKVDLIIGSYEENLKQFKNKNIKNRVAQYLFFYYAEQRKKRVKYEKIIVADCVDNANLFGI